MRHIGTLFLFAVFAFFVQEGGASNKNKPRSKFHEIGGHTYYINQELAMPWLQAAQLCTSIDMKLASLEQQAENDAVLNYMKTQNMTDKYWTSGNRVFDTWFWTSTGTAFTFTAWDVLQPNNTSGDSCMLTWGLKWSDEECQDIAYNVCE